MRCDASYFETMFRIPGVVCVLRMCVMCVLGREEVLHVCVMRVFGFRV